MKSNNDNRHERLIKKLSDIEDIDTIKSNNSGILKTRAIEDSFWDQYDIEEEKNKSSRLTKLLRKGKK